MAVRWKVKEVAQRNGVLSAVQLQERIKVANSTATQLWYGRPTRIDTPTLSKLCRAFNCQIGDLLEYVPGETDEVVDEGIVRQETPELMAA